MFDYEGSWPLRQAAEGAGPLPPLARLLKEGSKGLRLLCLPAGDASSCFLTRTGSRGDQVASSLLPKLDPSRTIERVALLQRY